MAVKFGMTVLEIMGQLTNGFRKVMGRDPDGLEKIKIQQEAVQRFKDMNKVVDMQGETIDTSKGIIGGRQIQDNKEFGEALKKALMETDNPYSDLVKTTQKRPKTIEQRRKEAEEALKNKNLVSLDEYLDKIDEPPPDKKADGGRAGYSKGIGPLLRFFSENNPIEAYKKYIQSVKKRAQEGDMKSLAPELGAVTATGVFINRRMTDVLENMKNQDMENNLENFKKELDADPFYKEYPELKDKMIENYTEVMFGEKKAQGGRAGFANGSPIDPMDPTNKLDEVMNAFRKLSRRSQNKIGFRKFFETYAEENFATGGRAGFANGSPDAPSITSGGPGAPSIKLDAEGSRSGRQQIKGAPEGITSDEETFNAIISADIPVSEKIDLLSKFQYGKGRTRIEKGGQEIFLDEGGFKSRDIGLGFNKEALLEGSDDEGLGGVLMYNLETGEPEFNVGYKKKFNFAGGGRANFDKGGMSRRKFMKIMGGIATLPILGKYIKPAMPLIQKGAELTGPALDKIEQTVMSAGKLISQSGKRLKELTTKKKLKDVEVEEDMMDGPSYTIKTKDKTIYYKPGRQDEMGIEDDIIEVIEDTVTKKAGGGIARMLGE